jgi:hypothetical protein
MPGKRMGASMSFSHANIVSILVAAVAAWIFGGVYYTSLSKWWMAAQGKTVEQCKAEQAGKSAVAMAAPFVVVFLAEIIMAWVLYGILVHLNMFTARAGLISGALCWLGFVVTTIASNNAFSNRRVMLTIIDSMAWLGALLIIGAILGAFGR